MINSVLYEDKLIQITPQTILLKGYHFPFGSKRVNLSEVERQIIEVTLRQTS